MKMDEVRNTKTNTSVDGSTQERGGGGGEGLVG